MQDIEPYWRWRDHYRSDEDEHSPFYGRTYSESQYSQTIYNYYIHPQWDNFGSETLYTKQLWTDYERRFVILEMLGEWNDTLHNDAMHFKRKVIDPLIGAGIRKFVLLCENLLTFHGAEDDYYQEWYEDVAEVGGWITMINLQPHVEDEMRDANLKAFIALGDPLNDVNWRPHKPQLFYQVLDQLLSREVKELDEGWYV